MPSQLKSDTARANGAKSRGPKTAETREKSSRNSLKHGFTARHIMLLACEDSAQFQEVVDEYMSMYLPTNFAERNLVEEMIGATWRIRRLKTIEVALVDYEMVRQEPELKKEMSRFDHGIHMGLSFRALADGSRSASLISRYESRLHRIHKSAQKILLDTRRTGWIGCAATSPASVSPAIAEPEPPPASTQTETSPPTPPEKIAVPPQPPAVAATRRRPICLQNNKFNNEPRIRRALRPIRNRRSLNAAFRRFKDDSSPAAQARSYSREAL
jgi:hypothetical protein